MAGQNIDKYFKCISTRESQNFWKHSLIDLGFVLLLTRENQKEL